MRKYCVALLTSILIGHGANSQDGPVEIAADYFRSNPFTTEFGSFLQHLVGDPGINRTELRKMTDTSLFYFAGTYKNHNPFFFKPKRIEVTLSQASVRLSLDSAYYDTIYLYELSAYNDYTPQGIKEMKKEFEKIHRRFKNDFYQTTFTKDSSQTGKSDPEWAQYNFFTNRHFIAPFSLSWIGPDENKEICLVLTLRIDNYGNRTVLPIPLKAP